MHPTIIRHHTKLALFFIFSLLPLLSTTTMALPATEAVIIQGDSVAALKMIVAEVGGVVTHELGIIDAVGGRLTVTQQAILRKHPQVSHIYVDNQVAMSWNGATEVMTLPAIQDSWITERYSNENYGSDKRLAVKKANNAKRERALFQFDLSDLPENALITSATAHIRVKKAKKHPIRVHRITSEWFEHDVSWQSIHEDIELMPSAVFTPTRAGWHSTFDVTQLVRGWNNGINQNYGIMLVSTTNRRTKYHSREANPNKQPYLEVEYILIESGLEPTFPTVVDADLLQFDGVDGSNVTVAVLDSGYWSHPAINNSASGHARVLAQFDAQADVLLPEATTTTDANGHGTHITSIIANSDMTSFGDYKGVAPDANLVSIKAFDGNGAGAYSDVIRGIDWAVRHKELYGIRVLNLSLTAVPQSYYWEDPLNQAVMRAWQAGIVVVAAAGNHGPDAMTIGVPGNVPYIITVGAMSDNFTTSEDEDDYVTSFSAAGPTWEGFIKPDVVAPGAHLVSLMDSAAHIAQMYPQYQSDDYFVMSGTSQATAVVAGVVALMLEAEPTLTPDDVKCRLMASALSAGDGSGGLGYSLFQQGAGLVNAIDAVWSDASGCANVGLDIAADLDDSQHFGGPANMDENGNFYVLGLDGSQNYWWDGNYIWESGNYAWGSGNYAWGSGNYAWGSGNYAWGSGNYAWGSGNYAWGSATASVNHWVLPE